MEAAPGPLAKRARTEVPSGGADLPAVAKTLAGLLLDGTRVQELANVEEMVDDALGLSTASGIVMYFDPVAKAHAAVVPVTLLPTPVPSDLYDEAFKMATAFHLLMDKVASDIPWLRAAFVETGKMDAVCGGLLRICDRVYGDGGKNYAEDIRLHVVRNDFMFDVRSASEGGFALRQIELNMIAASFSTHAQDLGEVHRYLLTKYMRRLDETLSPKALGRALSKMLPNHQNALGIAAALAQAHSQYVRRWRDDGRVRVVLVVAETSESNELDQRKLEAALFQHHGIVSLRRSIAELGGQIATLLDTCLISSASTATASTKHKALIVDGHEISVAYFRSGYWPGHFEKEGCWAAREAIEASEAVKCPSAPAQLAGMKKVQQLLCDPKQLRRFVDSSTADVLERAFARQSDPSSSSKEARESVQAATQRPQDWVMKPQVEGSGELIFDGDIAQLLQSRSSAELSEFILMERIRPPVTPSIVYHAEEGKRAEAVVRASVSELGVFGTFVANGNQVLVNKPVGHLLRSKAKETNQGGVFVRNAVVDTPLLVPPEVFWPAVSS